MCQSGKNGDLDINQLERHCVKTYNNSDSSTETLKSMRSKKKMVTMRALAVAICLVLGAVLPSFAFLFEIKPMDKTAIARLSDEDLINTYIDVEVEVEALQAFYAKGGLTPKDYKNFKDVLRYRILLVDELNKRGLDIPGSSKPFTLPAAAAQGGPEGEDKKTILIKE